MRSRSVLGVVVGSVLHLSGEDHPGAPGLSLLLSPLLVGSLMPQRVSGLGSSDDFQQLLMLGRVILRKFHSCL